MYQMSRAEVYRAKLKTLQDWDAYLLKESGLPSPRGNLELAGAVADVGNEALFKRYAALDASHAPANSPEEFLAFCGVVGFGKLLTQGKLEYLAELRMHASDPRWRTREGVAMALQRLGDADMTALLKEMRRWSKGNFLEQRAAAAALCEPRLLKNPRQIGQSLAILDTITQSIAKAQDRKSESFKALRKGMAYCWSVAVAALPDAGKPMMEHWFGSDDPDIRWIMKENLKKDRLARTDRQWMIRWRKKLG
jgi:hypothetical protein